MDSAPAVASYADANPEVALLIDRFGLTEQGAVDALAMNLLVGPLEGRLWSKGPADFAGLYISYEPTYAVVILSTSGDVEEMRGEVGLESRSLLPFIQVRRVDYTATELEVAINSVERNTDIPFVAEAKIQDGSLWFSTATEDQAKNLRSEILTMDMPVPASMIDVAAAGLMTQQSNSFGGLKLYTQGSHIAECTAGFSVEPNDGAGIDGVTTAGHCANSPGWEFADGQDLNRQDVRDSAWWDVEWFGTPGYDDQPWVNDGSGHKIVGAKTSRQNQAINDTVCLSKLNQNVLCGTIETKIFDPGTGYNATFIRVDGGSTNLSSDGDSGGPWWKHDGSGNAIAYGIHHGEVIADSNDAVYMAQNYLADLGIKVKLG